jgi:SAM-dependent methyltransferase
MSSYDLLARHYDAVTGDSSAEAEFIASVIKHANDRASTLLEVACGTGSIMAALADRYRVSGLDISPGVLSVAREKLSDGTALYLADMSDFRIGATFDAIICVYHGINHLLSLSDVRSFFACAHRHLNDGGVLVFDTLTIDDFKSMATRSKIVQKFGDNYLRIKVRPSDEFIFEWDIELFELQPGGKYKLLTELIRTAAYSTAEILAALGEKFINTQRIESDGNIASEAGGDRAWFVCSKGRTPDPAIPQPQLGSY